MLYKGLLYIVRIALKIFFRKIVVTGREHIPANGPLIIVANHPNTFMDPMIIASLTRQRIGFVANAGIFVNRLVSSVFSYFHVIPVYRKKDVAAGEKPDNTRSFEKCHAYLKEGRTFLIFPEGSSYYELRLREIKTGTARIALSYLREYDRDNSLKILPVSLDYSDAIQFRSMVSVKVSPPIQVSDYKEIYLQDEVEGVRRLTDAIRIEFAKNVPQTSGKEQEDFLIKSHKFYTCYFEPGADLYDNPHQSLLLRKQLSRAIRHVEKHDTKLYDALQSKVFQYFDELKKHAVTTGFFTDGFLRQSKLLVCLNYLAKFVLLLPLYIMGLAMNYIPYILPSKVYEASKMDPSYKAPVQLVVGIITFPLFYYLEIVLFRHYVTADPLFTFFLLLLLPALGYLAMYYWTEMRRFVRVLNFYFVLSSAEKQRLLGLRNQILTMMEEAKKELADTIR